MGSKLVLTLVFGLTLKVAESQHIKIKDAGLPSKIADVYRKHFDRDHPINVVLIHQIISGAYLPEATNFDPDDFKISFRKRGLGFLTQEFIRDSVLMFINGKVDMDILESSPPSFYDEESNQLNLFYVGFGKRSHHREKNFKKLLKKVSTFSRYQSRPPTWVIVKNSGVEEIEIIQIREIDGTFYPY